MKNNQLIQFTNKGFYCPQGDFYIDPKRKVKKALITHAHSDHAISGHTQYLSHYKNIPILKTRLGKKTNVMGVEYGEILNINGVKVTFFPSGHVIGSAQIKLQTKHESWVVTGDYKIENDNISQSFVPIKCDNFVTETTFAQPIYRWDSQTDIFKDMSNWVKFNQSLGLFSVVLCYSLGKAQRILRNLQIDGRIFTYKSVFEMNQAIESSGVKLPSYSLFEASKVKPGDLLLAPHNFVSDNIIDRSKYALAEASGWMKLFNPKNIDKKFVLSDHADWNGLNYAVKESQAARIFTTHGFTKTYTSWLRKKGYDAYQVEEIEDKVIQSE